MNAVAKAHAARAREFLTELADVPTVYHELADAPIEQWASTRLGAALGLVEILAHTIDQLVDQHDPPPRDGDEAQVA